MLIDLKGINDILYNQWINAPKYIVDWSKFEELGEITFIYESEVNKVVNQEFYD